MSLAAFARPLRCALSLVTIGLPMAGIAAQSAPAPARSVALEADALAYGINGTSGILSVTFANKLQVAAGAGSYDVPRFLLEGDANDEAAHWTARATSVQVARATYRLRGAMRSGLALGAVVLHQNWRLSAERLGGTTRFSPLSVGATAGYYVHIGPHFYVYPTTAFTYNRVVSGTAAVNGTPYKVNRFAPNASLHVGWEIAR